MKGHSSEKRWDDISSIVHNRSKTLLEIIMDGEEEYLDLLEVFQFAGGTNQLLADQLFTDINSGGTADSVQVAMVGDLSSAMLSVHEMFLAVTNGTVATKDRAADFRRMS